MVPGVEMCQEFFSPASPKNLQSMHEGLNMLRFTQEYAQNDPQEKENLKISTWIATAQSLNISNLIKTLAEPI
jgi:hypothetical protein